MVTMTLGIFSEQEHAEMAIAELEKAGFNPKEISVITKDAGTRETVAERTGSSVAEGTTSGATTGGVVGGLTGLLMGLGAISIPGLGALLIGGPIVAALGITGVAATTLSGAVTGLLAGGVVGALVGLGVPKETATIYEKGIKEGAILLAVPSATDITRDSARRILEDHGANQIESVEAEDNWRKKR